MHDHFGLFAVTTSRWLGSTWAFAAAGPVAVAWASTGSPFPISSQWAIGIGTGTGIATFPTVFLIQSTRKRDTRAINLTLNELIRAPDPASNQMIDIERMSDSELDHIQATYEQIKTSSPDEPA